MSFVAVTALCLTAMPSAGLSSTVREARPAKVQRVQAPGPGDPSGRRGPA